MTQKTECSDNRIPITGRTSLYGLLGSPVMHSLSPMMHNTSFQQLGIDAVYLCFDVTEKELKETITGLRMAGIRGFNLTMPCKNRAAELMDELDTTAALLGAVNTVRNENGKLTGFNTDGVGFMRSAREAGCRIEGKCMTVLGGGGAASAICAQAAVDGAEKLFIFTRPESRFHQRTFTLVENINRSTSCQAILLDLKDTSMLRNALEQSILLVNGTSVGMAPNTENSLIEDPAFLPKGLTVADVIYNPRKTRFLQVAEAAGCPTFNGMYMLLYQGAEAFRIWTGQDMPVDLIKNRFL